LVMKMLATSSPKNTTQNRRVLIGFTGTAARLSGGGFEGESGGLLVAKRLAYIRATRTRFAAGS
jgi:hypothetical protein